MKNKLMNVLIPTIAAMAIAFATFSLAACGQQGGEGQTPEPAPAPTPAPGPEPAAPGPVTFTDSRGVTITVENPQRVVACMGSFAHIWELAGGTLVGFSDDTLTGSYDIKSIGAKTVGDFSAPNLEAIIDLDPDFVILTSGSGGRGGSSSQTEIAASLEAAGIACAVFNVTTFPDYLDMLLVCCQITGDEQAFATYGQDVADRIEAIKAAVPVGTSPVVLMGITYSGGLRVQAGSTMSGSIVVELGGTNLADVNRSLLSEYSMEAVIEADPDAILLIAMGNTDDAAAKHLAESTAANPAWAELKAVKSGKYLALDPNLFVYKPCELWADAYQAVFDALYK